MTYTITIPVPPRILSPNYRGHWAPISAAKKQYRETCRYLALSAMGTDRPGWERATYTVEWYTPTKRTPDEDNASASLKAAFDGLQDAGLIANDKGLKRDGPIVFAVDKANPRVVLRVKPRDSAHARERAIQRYGHYITNDRAIVSQILSGQAARVCDLDGSRALYTVQLGQRAAFVVYDAANKVVVTCLPPGRHDYRLVQAMADVILRQQRRLMSQTAPDRA